MSQSEKKEKIKERLIPSELLIIPNETNTIKGYVRINPKKFLTLDKKLFTFGTFVIDCYFLDFNIRTEIALLNQKTEDEKMTCSMLHLDAFSEKMKQEDFNDQDEISLFPISWV